jgi:hypothetical protein
LKRVATVWALVAVTAATVVVIFYPLVWYFDKDERVISWVVKNITLSPVTVVLAFALVAWSIYELWRVKVAQSDGGQVAHSDGAHTVKSNNAAPAEPRLVTEVVEQKPVAEVDQVRQGDGVQKLLPWPVFIGEIVQDDDMVEGEFTTLPHKPKTMQNETRISLEQLVERRSEKGFFKNGKPKVGFHRACQDAAIKPDTVDDWMKELHSRWSDPNYLPDLSNIPKNPE